MQKTSIKPPLTRAGSHSLLKRGSSFSSLYPVSEAKKEERLAAVKKLLADIEARLAKAEDLAAVRDESELACQLRADLRAVISYTGDLIRHNYYTKLGADFGPRLKKCGKDLELITAELDLEHSESSFPSPPSTPKVKF